VKPEFRELRACIEEPLECGDTDSSRFSIARGVRLVPSMWVPEQAELAREEEKSLGSFLRCSDWRRDCGEQG
jgi:hypothetical protein